MWDFFRVCSGACVRGRVLKEAPLKTVAITMTTTSQMWFFWNSRKEGKYWTERKMQRAVKAICSMRRVYILRTKAFWAED